MGKKSRRKPDKAGGHKARNTATRPNSIDSLPRPPKQVSDMLDLADAFLLRGLHREAADKYLEAVHLFEHLDDPWRFHAYTMYSVILNDAKVKYPTVEITKTDFKNLDKIADSDTEPTVYRVDASFLNGQLRFQWKEDLDLTNEYYRQALQIMNAANEEDKNLLLVKDKEVIRAEEQMVHVRNVVTNWLSQVSAFNSSCDQNPFLSRVKAGGGECDACGKTLAELGVTRLNCCTRCKKAYYCGPECQRKKWVDGHKQACRKPKQIEVDDIMKFTGDERFPLIRVIGPDGDAEGCWKVHPVDPTGAVDARYQPFSASAENMQHLRPAA